tara:strand:- start:71 stop:673 length:603 start_codon:yes stop_codon:yes gene_type:complete
MVTKQRKHRIQSTLNNRQPDLTVILEEIHDDHNVNAILRSAEAVGVVEVYFKYKDEFPNLGYKASASSYKWLEYHKYSNATQLASQLQKKGFKIYSTVIDDSSTSIYEIDWTEPSAIIMGNENKGVSNELKEISDKTIYIPMRGMVESLNVSVASAVTLYEASRQRMNNNQYPNKKINSNWLENKYNDWIRINYKCDESS